MACEKKIIDFKQDEEGLWVVKEVPAEPEEGEREPKDQDRETKPGNGKNQRRKHRGGRRDH